jgi:hypothetical protein
MSGKLCGAHPFYCTGKMGKSLSTPRVWFLYQAPTTYMQKGVGPC